MNMKFISKYLRWMFGCSIVAMLINPLFLIVVRVGDFIYAEEPILVLFYFISYVIVGSVVWYLFRNKKWKTQTFWIWLVVNLVLLAQVICWIRTIGDGMTGLMFLTAFGVGSLLSALPIGFYCYNHEFDYPKGGFPVYVEREAVCMGDDCNDDKSIMLSVNNIEDLAIQLKRKFLPNCAGDVTWFAHISNLDGPVVFKIDIPVSMFAKPKVYDVSPTEWLHEGVLLYMEYERGKCNLKRKSLPYGQWVCDESPCS